MKSKMVIITDDDGGTKTFSVKTPNGLIYFK